MYISSVIKKTAVIFLDRKIKRNGTPLAIYFLMIFHLQIKLLLIILVSNHLTYATNICASVFISPNASSTSTNLVDRKLFTQKSKNISSTLEENKYLLNTNESIENVFKKWLKTTDDSYKSFMKMITTAHLVAALGINSNHRIYSTKEYTTSDIFPGLTRTDVNNIDDPHSLNSSLSKEFHFLVQRKNYKFFPALSKFDVLDAAMDTAYKNVNFNQIKVGDLLYFKFSIYNQDFIIKSKVMDVDPELKQIEIQWSNQIDQFHIPEKISPYSNLGLESSGLLGPVINSLENKKNILTNTVVYQVPEPQYIDYYFQHAWGKITNVKKLLKTRSQKIDSSIDDKIVENLADYYQIMISAHPFVRINHSLFLNQINSILLLMERRPLPHAHLDHLAMILDSKEFRRLVFSLSK